MKITLPDASEVARVLSDDHVPALRGGGDHHAARPSPHVQMIVRLEWLSLLLVALSLMVRPVPVALAEVPDGITTNDEHQPYQFDVTAHTPCWTLALARSPHVAAAALEHLMASAQMLELGPLYTRGLETETLARAARERGFRVSQDARGADAVIDLPASPAEFPLSRNLMSTTLRKKRRLTRLGQLRFDMITRCPGS